MPKYKIGKYTQAQLNNKRKYIRKKKYNKTSNGTLTIRQKNINEKRAITFLLVSLLFGATYAFVMTSNTIHIDSNFVEAKAETRLSVNQQPVEESLNLHSLSSRVVEVSAENQIRNIAKEHNFKWTDYLVRLAFCESSLNPNAIGDNGASRGLFQIHKGYHPTITDEQAFNIRFSTIWTMKKINEGKQHLWSCNKIVLNNN